MMNIQSAYNSWAKNYDEDLNLTHYFDADVLVKNLQTSL
jgi:hypothetical protein